MDTFQLICHFSLGLVIEEITEEATVSSDNHEDLTSDSSVLSEEASQRNASQFATPRVPQSANTNYMEALKDDPESIRFVDVVQKSLFYCLHVHLKKIEFSVVISPPFYF